MMSGNKITQPQDPTKTDQYFAGWYSDSELTQRWNFDKIAREDTTLHAKWRDTEFPYDAEVKYLESTGTQWIDTKYIPNLNTEIFAKVNTGIYGGQWNVFFGVTRSDSQSDGVLARWFESDTVINGWFCQNNYTEALYDSSQNTDVEIELKSGLISFNETTYTTAKSGQTPYAGSIYLFCGNNGGETWRHSQCRIYNFSAVENDMKKIDLIPVRIGSVGYMYDKVSGELFENKGTGNFILGPDKA